MKKIWVWLAIGFWALSAGAASVQTAKDLAVDFQKEPLAIDSARPRFSWQISVPERGAAQSAYQILVSVNNDFNKSGGILWDSGKVSSSENSGLAYSGPALSSKTKYFWKVRTWDKIGKPCADSEVYFFQTGIMDAKDLKGQWVWEDTKVKLEDYAYFRTEFNLDDNPAEAYALVSAHNGYMLYINGEQVSGYVNPGSSDPKKSKLYVTYSIGRFLHKGRNAVAAAAFYKGANGQNYVNGVPGFLFECWGKTKDGKALSLASGPDWKVLANTPFDEKAPWLSGRKTTASEFFDARKEPVGWKQAGFDDSGWTNAAVVNTGFNLRSQYMPESNIIQVLTPLKRTSPLVGVYVFKLPSEISGWGRVTATAPAGTQVTMRYSDRLVAGRAYRGAADEPTRTYFDKYTFAGKGEESWGPEFGYRGFRYIEVTGFKGKPDSNNIKGIFAATNMKQTASFSSSNDLLNKIYEISVHTQAMSMLGQLVDCANREQSQWHADAEIESGTVFYNFYDPAIVRKTLIDLKDGQWDDGRLPDFYPANPRDFNYIPEWDMRYVPMLWRAYFYYNDVALLEECWPVIVKQIKYYEGLRDSTGLIGKGGKKIWHISDWPGDFAKVDHSGQYLTVENLLFYDTLVKSANIAKILNHPEEEKQYRESAAKLKTAINKHLYDNILNAYRDCSKSGLKHQGVSALALQVGVVPESERNGVMTFVKSQRFGSSVVLAYNLFEMLYDNDEGAFAYNLVNSENMPGWGYMVKRGYTTTWEGWTGLFGETYEHPFAAYMGRFLISGIVGIKPGAPGWSAIEIRPHVDGNLKWAKASMRILPGEVAASWEKTADGLKMSVDVPGNTKARVSIPAPTNPRLKIFEGETQIFPVGKGPANPEIQLQAREKDYVVFSVGAGAYSFKVVN